MKNKYDKDTFINKVLEYKNYKSVEQQLQPCYNMLDLWLVLIHTFIYMGNYYGLASTAGGYTKSFEIDPGMSGII